MYGGAFFFCLPFCGRCQCGRPCRLSGCGVSSFRSSLVSSLSFPRSGSPCLPVASVLLCVVLAPPRRHAVGGEGIISSSLALLVRYGERGAGSGRGLRRVMALSCPLDVVLSRPVLAVVALYVDCVAWRFACRSCGILILSIGCIYRLIGFLICPICLLLPLSVSSAR